MVSMETWVPFKRLIISTLCNLSSQYASTKEDICAGFKGIRLKIGNKAKKDTF